MAKLLRLILIFPAVSIAAAIFLISSREQPEIFYEFFTFQDKIGHLLAYFVFGITIIIALAANKPEFSLKKIMLWTLLIGSLYGLSDETHQYFVPGREPDFFDWVADIAGISLSLLLAKNLTRKFCSLLSKVSNELENKENE